MSRLKGGFYLLSFTGEFNLSEGVTDITNLIQKNEKERAFEIAKYFLEKLSLDKQIYITISRIVPRRTQSYIQCVTGIGICLLGQELTGRENVVKITIPMYYNQAELKWNIFINPVAKTISLESPIYD